MTRIIFLIGTNQFRFIYLRNKKKFPQFCSAILEFGLNAEHLGMLKIVRIIASVFRKLHTRKDVVR